MSGSVLDADMATIARQLRAGWRWWLSEIASLVPTLLRRRGSLQSTGWVVTLDQDPPTVTRKGREALPVANAPATAVLPRSACLFRTITLPALSARDTRRMLDLQIGRLMPFPPGAGITDVLLGPIREGRRDVSIATLPVQAASAAESTLLAAGFRPAAITIQDANGVSRYDFLPALRRARGEPERATPRRIWWRIVAAMFTLNLLLLIATDMLALRNLDRLVEAHSSVADGVRRARRRIQDEARMRDNVLSRRIAHDPLALIADLSRRLPERARIDRLMIGTEGIRIVGVRPTDVDVLGAMRAGGRYPDVHSTTPDALAETPQGQPFDIAFGWPMKPR